jgi:hypothetical protein
VWRIIARTVSSPLVDRELLKRDAMNHFRNRPLEWIGPFGLRLSSKRRLRNSNNVPCFWVFCVASKPHFCEGHFPFGHGSEHPFVNTPEVSLKNQTTAPASI